MNKILLFNEFLNENKKDPDAKVRNRGDVVFSAKSKDVTDDQDHFPINSEDLASQETNKTPFHSNKGTLNLRIQFRTRVPVGTVLQDLQLILQHSDIKEIQRFSFESALLRWQNK